MFPIARSPWLVGCFALLCWIGSACTSTQTTPAPTAPAPISTVEKTKTKAKKGIDNNTLVFSPDMRRAAAYQDIKGNIPRLKAMLSGRYVQYRPTEQNGQQIYRPWYVNEGQDSMVIYAFPVGDPNRHGHWMYLYQYMTSLPDEPIYTAFVLLQDIDRDTILATYYEQPGDFGYSLTELLEDPVERFRTFKFDALKLSKNGEVVHYKRQTPLKYIGHSQWMDNPSQKGGFLRDYYVVSPANYLFGEEEYDQNKKFTHRRPADRLMKMRMLAPNLLGR